MTSEQLFKKKEQLKRIYPNLKIDTLDVLIIEGKEKFGRVRLSNILGVTVDTIKDYENKGMPRSKYSLKTFILYDLKECIDWILLNIDSKRTKRKNKATSLPDTINENDWKTRKERADALKTEESAEIEKIKKKELLKELVKVEDTDKAMAELGAIFVSNYRNDLKLLPVLLSKKEQRDIKNILDKHYEDRIDNMEKIVNKTISINSISIYDILYTIINNQNLYELIEKKINNNTKGV